MLTLSVSRRSIALLFALMASTTALLMPPAAAQFSEIEEVTAPIVSEIRIQYVGPETISRERILANMRTTIGQPYSDLAVEEDIRSLFATQEISNVRIFSEPVGQTVRVVVVAETRANVREVVFTGATSINANRLRREIETKPGESLSENTIQADQQKIIDLYQTRGFSDVSVTYDVETDSTLGTSRVTFKVDEGSKGIVRRIEFEGNTAFTTRELRKVMKTRGRNILSFINKSGRLEDAQLAEDVRAIEDAYADRGYIDASVEEVRRERVNDRRIDLIVVITEGIPYSLGTLSITGNDLFTQEQIREKLTMVEGSVYSPSGLRANNRAIQDLYGKDGYVDLVLIPDTVPGGPGIVNLNYILDEGFQSYLERVNIEGNTITRDKVIRRELAIDPGDIFDTTRVETSRARLQNLGYFSRVETFPEDTLIPGRKDLTIVVEEQRTGSFNFGAGFSSIDNVIGFAEVQQGNFDIKNWPRFTGGGQKFRARAQYGAERQDYVIGLTEPWFMDRQLSLGGEVFFREAQFLSDVYDQRNVGFALTTRQPLGAFTSLRTEYRIEDIDVFDVDPDASEEFQLEAGNRLKSQLTFEVTYDTRDSVFLTRRGERVTLTTYFAGGILGGDTDLYGWSIEATKYFPLPYDGIFLLSGEVGVVDSDSRVPLTERLYLGGANNLRGFSFRDVGPKDEFGEPIGGQTLARITAEVTFPIIERVRGAVFYDAGFVNSGSYDFSGSNINSDIGVGLRVDLPIGPVRVDFGVPLQTDNFNDSSGKFQFNVGYQF